MNKKIERVKHRVEEILKLNMKLNDDWKLNEVTEKVKDLIILPSSQYVKKKWRKVVTGDEQKRVRDHIKEKKRFDVQYSLCSGYKSFIFILKISKKAPKMFGRFAAATNGRRESEFQFPMP